MDLVNIQITACGDAPGCLLGIGGDDKDVCKPGFDAPLKNQWGIEYGHCGIRLCSRQFCLDQGLQMWPDECFQSSSTRLVDQGPTGELAAIEFTASAYQVAAEGAGQLLLQLHTFVNDSARQRVGVDSTGAMLLEYAGKG